MMEQWKEVERWKKIDWRACGGAFTADGFVATVYSAMSDMLAMGFPDGNWPVSSATLKQDLAWVWENRELFGPPDHTVYRRFIQFKWRVPCEGGKLFRFTLRPDHEAHDVLIVEEDTWDTFMLEVAAATFPELVALKHATGDADFWNLFWGPLL